MDKILELLRELRPEFDFETSTNFIEDGYLDSFDVTTLVQDLEDEFGCIIDGSDIKADAFKDIKSIIALVKKSGGDI